MIEQLDSRIAVRDSEIGMLKERLGNLVQDGCTCVSHEDDKVIVKLGDISKDEELRHEHNEVVGRRSGLIDEYNSLLAERRRLTTEHNETLRG